MSEFHRLDADADAPFLRAGVADPLTRVPFRAANEVVLCGTCGTVSLRETWEALGRCPNGHDTPVAWDPDAALAAGDGAAGAAPRPAERPLERPGDRPLASRAAPARPAAVVEAESRNRWLTPLLVALGVAGLVVLAVVTLGLLRDGDDAPVVEEVVAPTAPTGPEAQSVDEPGLIEGALAEGDFETAEGRYQDLYTFAADSSGRVLSFTVTSADFYPDLLIETPEGDRVPGELATEDPDTGARTVAVDRLRGPGLYRIYLTSRQPAQAGAYALRIRRESPVRPLAPNGSAVQAELGAFSENADGFFRDRYQFTATADREHTVTVRSSAFAPTVQVEGPGGAVRGETGRAGGVVTFVFTPSRAGTYTALVSSQSRAQRGAYAVQLAVEAAPPPEPEARALPNGRALSDSLAVGDTRAYTLQGRTGDRIVLEVRADGFTPSLTIVGPDGTRTPASPDGDRARINNFVLPTAGTYRVLVGAPSGSGSYRVTLDQQAAVTADDIPRLPGAEVPRSGDGQGPDRPQPVDGQ